MSNRWEEILLQAGCDPGVREHCRIVWESARRYNSPFADPDLVEGGAMLHDIGRARTHGIDHAQVGAEIARKMRVADSMVRIIECHIGAGLTADECTLLRLLPRDSVPQRLEEKIVAHADNMVEGKTIYTLPETILFNPFLPKRVRRRMFRLALEVTSTRDVPASTRLAFG